MDVATNLKKEKAKQLAIEEAKKIVAARDPADDLDKIAEKNSLKISESDSFAFSTGGYISGKPSSVVSKTVMPKAFKMEIGEIAGPFEGRNGAYIIQLLEREKSDYKKLQEDDKTKSALHDQILREKQRKAYDDWYQKIRNEAEITSFIPAAS